MNFKKYALGFISIILLALFVGVGCDQIPEMSTDTENIMDNKVIPQQTETIEYWVNRIKNNGSDPLSVNELAEVPDEVWYQIVPQVIRVVKNDGVLGASGEQYDEFTCLADECTKLIGRQAYEPILGYSVATGYKTTLRTSMTASQSYIPVSSMLTKDGTTLTASDLGGKVFLTAEPGANKEEILKCADSTATNWTSCTRGLAFSGTTETAVAENAETHNAGSIVVMSNVHYVYEQYVENNENDLSFGDGTSTTYKTITFNAGNPSGLDPGFRWNTSTNQLEFRRYDESSYRVMETNFRGVYADYATLPSTDNAQGDTAITSDDYKMYTWNVGSSAWVLIGGSSGAGTIYKTELLGSEATGADSRTFTLTSGSWPNEKFLQVFRNGQFMRQGASYDYVATTTNAIYFNYDVNDTDTISMYVVSIDLYNADWANVSEDLLPDTDATHDIGSSSLQFKDGYFSGTVSSSDMIVSDDATIGDTLNVTGTSTLATTTVNGTDLQSLLDSSTTTLHSHAKTFGQTTRNNGSGTGSQTIAHGLGVVPNIIRIQTFWFDDSADENIISIGIASDSTDELCQTTAIGVNSSEANAEQIVSHIICLEDSISTDNGRATVSSTDATNIELNWTTAVNSAGVAFLQWEAEY